MKNLIFLALILLSSFANAQLKFDVGLTLTGALKKEIDLGQLIVRGNTVDTNYVRRTFQPGALSIHAKQSIFFHDIGKFGKGLVSFPINIGISSIISSTTQSGSSSTSSTQINIAYDASILYGIGGGSYTPEDDGSSNFGYFFQLGVGMTGLTKNPDYDEEYITKDEANVKGKYLYYDDPKSGVNKMTIGPVLHIGIVTSFLDFIGFSNGTQGVSTTFRPGFGNNFSYLQVSFFAVMF